MLDADSIEAFQSFIGSLQWVVSLECFDFDAAVMTLSTSSSTPSIGHFDCAKCLCSYLFEMMHDVLPCHTNEPDNNYLTDFEFELEATVYMRGSE